MAKDLTSFNTGFLDTLLLEPDRSPFDYHGFNATSHYAQDHIDYDPSNAPAGFNSTAYITQPRGDYIIGKVQLTFTVSAIAKATGTYARLMDFGAYQCIESIQCKQGNVDLISPYIETDDLVLLYNMSLDRDERDHTDLNIGANLSSAERDSAALANQNFLVELPVWWSDHPGMYLNMKPFNKDLQYQIKFRSLVDVIETDATTPSSDVTATISNIKLRVFHYTQPEQVLNRQTALTDSRMPNQASGQLKKTVYWEKQLNNVLTSGSQAFTVKLDGIKGNVIDWCFIVRPSANINPGNANQDRLTFVNIASWELYDGNTLVIRNVDSQYNRMYLYPHWYSGVPGNYIFGYSYSLTPENFLNSTGHLTHGSFKDPKLKVYFSGATGTTYRLDFFARSHQFIQHKDEQVRPLFE